jgi:integrase
VSAYGRTHTRTFRGSEAAARKALRVYELDLRGGGHDTDRTTVAELVETFMLSRDLSPTTLAEYRRAQDVLNDSIIHSQPIHKLRAPDLDALYRQLGRDRVNVHTIRRIHEVLSAAFAKAVGWGYIDRNPAEHASPPPRPRSERQAVSAADLRALLDACPPKLKLWVRLAFVTGARRGEVCGLQWRDVNLERGTLVVRRNVVYTPASGVQVKETKTGKVHVVALDPETVRLLKEHAKVEGEVAPPRHQLSTSQALGGGSAPIRRPHSTVVRETDTSTFQPKLSGASGTAVHLNDRWLFTHDVDGAQPWRPDYVTLTIRRLQAKVGVNFPIHSIRHGTATELLDGGFALGVASERLGHDNQTTTARIYAHALPARDREAAEYLAGRLE